MKYTIICPLRVDIPSNGWTIFQNASLHSYNKYLNVKDVESFIIICPQHNMPIVQTECKKYPNIPFMFFSDEQILEQKCENVSGWLRQQIIKLCISKYISTYYYLIVDSDMYITRPLNKSDLFYNGRVKYVFEPWQTANDSHYSTNSNWWLSSCRVLNLNEQYLFSEKHLMGVTPQVFITIRVHQLLAHLHNSFGKDWQNIICKASFTEFTLYWLFMRMYGYDKSEYTHEGEPIWKHNKTINVLEQVTEQTAIEIVKNSFNVNSPIFSVIQGYLHIPFIHNLCAAVRDNLGLYKQVYDAVFIIPSMVTPTIIRTFQPQERFLQTLHTITTIREKIPNSCCIVVEGSTLMSEQEEMLNKKADYLILCDDNEEIQHRVRDVRNIGIGECKLLQIAIQFIIDYNILTKTCFKISARYYLNENFNFNNYDLSKYNFRKHMDDSINKYVYTTGLFTIPPNRLQEFLNILDIMLVQLDQRSMVERFYYTLIPQHQVNDLKILGLGGQLSYNGKLIDE